ncbi:seryl-tRNA synthetase [Humidesulfovibrio mexicanus]|uniref:Serine--tRNA ligase n=1 Tax=Humidesulfovibrio mexicanus TaxID=147047 RepID=A0A238Y910_9BACT|nr:serine--tRNA ligase [Humidesulfovibrio mexicanus]SNR67520.1 seryl-tRNA synthetase [Humidesulfovibrio mexicanus]
MLDLKFVQKNLDAVSQGLARRCKTEPDVAEFARLDEARIALIREAEALKAERNSGSAEVAKLKRAGQDATELMARMSAMGERVKELDAELAVIEAQERDWLLKVPNIPHESTPDGCTENDNPVLRHWGAKPEFAFAPKEHWELGQALGGLDFERAGKLTGSRFCVSFGWAARLERALGAFMLDCAAENGYTEVIPPYIVNKASMTGTGQLPKFEEDLFKIQGQDYYLIPTAEVPVTNLHAGEVLEEDQLPLGYCALTPCFRSEAGSYGKDTKGLIRQHQFHKVELVRFAHPDTSFEELERLTGHAEMVLQRLGLHYRVIQLCGGDLGFSSCKTYDIEVWLPGQDKYREISSCSNFLDFQARRANIRFKAKGAKKSEFLHTLNGSGLAVGRTLVAVLENGQQADGSVLLPEALRPYMGGVERIGPK